MRCFFLEIKLFLKVTLNFKADYLYFKVIDTERNAKENRSPDKLSTLFT